MRFGVCLPTFRYGAEPTGDHLVAIARRAEELQYDSVWAGDHVLVPADQTRMRFFSDPLVTLAFVAGFTRRLILGTSIVVAPLRNPLVLAKQAATLDFYSRGRLVLGLGGGWLEPEFRYLGADFEGRGRLFDETLRILRTLWRDCPASFHGEFHSFTDAVLEPRPARPEGPPLWIGGSTPRALRRVAELGDAWHADDTPPDAVARGLAEIRRLADPFERQPGVTTRVTVKIAEPHDSRASRVGYYRAEDAYAGIAGSGEALREQVEQFRAAGSTHFIAQFEHGSVEQHIACLETFAADVMQPLRGAAPHRVKGANS
jgi:probable F420-dependent oxidoreductase